jgi:predicted amidophosphoribosyltransferase
MPSRSGRQDWGGLVQAGVEIIFPPVCVFCRKICLPDPQFPGICKHCLAGLPLRIGCKMLTDWSQMSGTTMPAGSRIFCAAYYQGAVREALLRMKFADAPDIAEGFASLLVQMIRRSGIRFSAVAAVPLHPERCRERGYNQSALLAGHVSARTGLPDWSPDLMRVRATERQSAASDRMTRMANMAGAFGAVSGFPRNDGQSPPVLLIDDVLTTGATLTAAAEPVRHLGWQVTGMVVASDHISPLLALKPYKPEIC